jgi:hypothetical protein
MLLTGFDVYHRNRCHARWLDATCGRGWMGLRNQGYDEHARAHDKCASHERPSPTNSVDKEKQEKATAYDLDNPEEASDE